MGRRLDEANRHFLTLKKRVDRISQELAPEESLQAAELVDDVVGAVDTATLTVSQKIIDGFEDNNINEYAGDKSNVSLQSSVVKDGSIAAEISAGSNFIYSLDGGGLNEYPEPGDIFESYHYINASGGIPRVFWGVVTSINWYMLEIDEGAGNVEFFKEVSGSRNSLDSESATIPTAEWLRVEVEWRTSGRHLITVENAAGSAIATLDATDTKFTDGGFGWAEDS